MFFDVCGARDEPSQDWADSPCDEVRVVQVTHTNGTVEAFSDNVDEAIAIARMYVEQWMPSRQLREHRSEVRRPERQGRRNAQLSVKITRR